MALIPYVFCLCILLPVFTRVVKSAHARYRCRQAITAANCEPVVKCRSWDPIFGLDTFVRLGKAHVQGKLSRVHRELHDTHGPTFEMMNLGRPQIYTAQAEIIQAVCTSSFNDWGVEPLRGRIGKPFIDRGIFTDDGAYWKHARSLVRPTFNRTEIADLANFEHHVQRLLKLIPSDGSTFDLQSLVKRLFLDTSTEFLFGRSVESLLPETPFETDEFMKAFDRSLLGLAFIVLLGPFRWPLYLDPWWRAASTRVHKFVDKQVDMVLKKRQKSKVSVVGKKVGTIDHAAARANEKRTERFVLLEGMAQVTQDPYDLRMQAVNAFFPARDTTAIAFSTAIFMLARHPSAWQALRQEVLALDLRPHQLTYEVVRSLKVVRSIINESLRLHPPAPRNGRAALRDTILPKGGGLKGDAPVFIPAGTVLRMDLYSLHRDPAIWGDDANSFRPERWMAGPDGQQRPLWEARWQYEPFLGGARMCPAQNMVTTQLSYLLVRFAQEFETLDNRDPVFEYVEETSISTSSKNGVKIALTRNDK